MQYQNFSFSRIHIRQLETDQLYTSPDLMLLYKLQDLIEQNFRSIHDHEFYAQSLRLTISGINNITRFFLQKTVYELIQNRIHEEAKYLLRHTTMSAKEISYELGICDPSYFGKWFKRREGVSPNSYRHQGKYEQI